MNSPLQNQGQAHSTPAAYPFQYRVHDQHSGDTKGHNETRNEDRVDGQYDLIDSDGLKRTVQYVVDKHIGVPTSIRTENSVVQQQVANVQALLTDGLAYERGYQQILVQDHNQYSGWKFVV